MAYENIDLETLQPNGKTGEPGPTAWAKARRMFKELYKLWQTNPNVFPYFDKDGNPTFSAITEFARTLIDDADAATALKTLGLGTPSTFGKALLAAADQASARNSLGLGSAALASILGTVSMSGGVPNGSIIERISNANGKAVRFADGTQICRVTKSATWNANGAGGAYWLYPAAFYEAPGVIAMISTASPQTYNASAEAVGTSGCNLWAGGSLGATGTIQAWAFGNWAA